MDLNLVRSFNEAQRFAYFCKYAGHIEDSPKLCYAIRVGSKTLMSNDTFDLRAKFDAFLGLREHGWKKGFIYSRNRKTIWWTKTDDLHSVSQSVALKQQQQFNRKVAKA